MLLGLLSEEPLPVRALLGLFQRKLDAPRPHLVLGCLRVHLQSRLAWESGCNPATWVQSDLTHLFQELHVELKSSFLSAPSTFEEKRVFLHLGENIEQPFSAGVITFISGFSTSDTLIVRKMIFGLWAHETLGVSEVWAAMICSKIYLKERPLRLRTATVVNTPNQRWTLAW